jgi:hypothetical protein
MFSIFVVGAAVAGMVYLALQLILHVTQSEQEPRLVESTIPFLDSTIGIARERANYLTSLGYSNTRACLRD